MTSYHGGKQRIGKDIAETIYMVSTIIEDYSSFKIKGYCEPFCGMLGVYQHIPHLFEGHKPKLKYKAGDINESVIKMWKATQKGWVPPTRKYSKKEFLSLAGNGDSSAEKGYVGHFYGYMGKYFKPFENRSTKTRRQNTPQKIVDIAAKLDNVQFTHGSYTQFSQLKGYIIYCDPPYQIQHYYYDQENNKLSFDHDKFWNWCRMMSRNNIVFVSEYNAPDYFQLVWKHENSKEKLFICNKM